MEGRGGRKYPGEGELPLVELLDALPKEIGIAVEAPDASLVYLPIFDRAVRCGEATRKVVEQAHR